MNNIKEFNQREKISTADNIKQPSVNKVDGQKKPSSRFRKNMLLTETRKAIVLNDLIDAASPNIEFFALLLFSCTIATIGLIGDLPVVTMGAQLISPLMLPILGVAISSLIGLKRLFKRSILAIVKGIGFAIGLSAIITFFLYRLPYSTSVTIPNEVWVRTSVSTLDLSVAIIAGMAAAYVIGNPHLNTILPGVALATSLVPPLCTMGFGIAFWNTNIIFGAGLLFLTNFTAIIFSAIVTFGLMGFRPTKKGEHTSVAQPLIVSSILVAAISVPLFIFAWNTVQTQQLTSTAETIINEDFLEIPGAELVDLSIIPLPDVIEVSISAKMAEPLSESEMDTLENLLFEGLKKPILIEFTTLVTAFSGGR